MLLNSFSFGNVNSVEQWGMHVISADTLLPQKRPRKITVPGHSGTYDYGANSYDERILRLECHMVSKSKITRSQLREIAYLLSRKDKLRLWEEPDKYYLAELYAPPEILSEAGGHVQSIVLEFVCQPFAMGERVSLPISSGTTRIAYEGTAPAPLILTLTNHGSSSAAGISVTMVYRGKSL